MFQLMMRVARTTLRIIIGQLRNLKVRIDRLEKEIIACHRKNPESNLHTKRCTSLPRSCLFISATRRVNPAYHP